MSKSKLMLILVGLYILGFMFGHKIGISDSRIAILEDKSLTDVEALKCLRVLD